MIMAGKKTAKYNVEIGPPLQLTALGNRFNFTNPRVVKVVRIIFFTVNGRFYVNFYVVFHNG